MNTPGMLYPRAFALAVPLWNTYFPSVLSGSWQVLNEHWSEWMNSLSCVTMASYLRSLFQ